jgi:hypothetical protein
MMGIHTPFAVRTGASALASNVLTEFHDAVEALKTADDALKALNQVETIRGIRDDLDGWIRYLESDIEAGFA